MKDETITVRNTQSGPLNIQQRDHKKQAIYFERGEVKTVPLDADFIQVHIECGALEIVEKPKKAEDKKEDKTEKPLSKLKLEDLEAICAEEGIGLVAGEKYTRKDLVALIEESRADAEA